MKGEPVVWKIGQGLIRVWLETNLEINSQVVCSEGKCTYRIFFFNLLRHLLNANDTRSSA